MFRAAKDTSRALRVTLGLQAPGAIVRLRRKFCVFHQRALPQSPGVNGIGGRATRTPGGHAHPDVPTHVRPSGVPPGDTAGLGFSGLQLQAKSQG